MAQDDNLISFFLRPSQAISMAFSTTERRYFSLGGMAGLLFTGAIMVSSSQLPPMHISFPTISLASLPQNTVISSPYKKASPAESQIAALAAKAQSETHLDVATSAHDMFVEADEEPFEATEIALDPRFPMDGESIVTVELGRGDTLSDLLAEHDIHRESVAAIISAMRSTYNPRKMRAGQQVTLELRHTEGRTSLEKMEFAAGRLERVEVNAAGENYKAAKVTVPTTRSLVRAGGTITSSFYEAGMDAGLTPKLIVELMKAYSYDVDFARDIKPGQKIDVMFEQIKDEDGNLVGTGAMKYATLTLGKKEIEIFRYEDKSGFVGYYTPSGESVRNALIKTPINGARISSGYGMRRHPVLGYSRMHKGVDFAAPRGTPVYAAGDGVVRFASRKGSYGNYVRISHNGTYSTAYAHLHRFAKGIYPGKRVKQGQIIAYVGTTGRSTGPHLHYEILKHGSQVNPRGVSFKTGGTLQGRELAEFKKHVSELKNQFARLPRIQTQMASAE